MDRTQERYPLSWPNGWKRTPSWQRRQAPFSKRVQGTASTYARKERLGIGDGLERLAGELRRLGATGVVISSNLRLRNDGLPYSQQAKQLDDPGVAVYFKLKGKPHALACDKWNSAAENMAAIAGHIDALRTMERYGVGSVEQAFAGYVAIGHAAGADWWLELGVTEHATIEQIEAAYREKARTAHPDAGGSHDLMSRLNAARDAARKARA